MPISSYMISPGDNPSEFALRRKLAAAMLKEGTDTSPVQHWTQGLAKLAQAGMAGWELGQLDKAEREERRRTLDAIMSHPALAGQSPGQSMTGAPQGAAPQDGQPPQPGQPNVSSIVRALSVPATSRVWDDAEAEAAGLYESKPVSPGTQKIVDALAGKKPGVAESPAIYSTRSTDNNPANRGTVTPGDRFEGFPSGGRQAGTIPPEYQNYIRGLVANPRTRQQGLALLNEWSKPREDKTQFGVIGQDQFGQPQYGWVDPRSRSIQPVGQGGRPQGEPVIPPPPPGVDPKLWREHQTRNYVAGQLPPPADDVSGLRKEVRSLPSVKNLTEVAPRISAMRDALGRDNRAADLTLIYGLMKVQDPTSVVRESEADMAANIATIPEKFRAQVESFLQGKGRLAPEVRQAMLAEAVGLGQAHYEQYHNDTEQYRGIAQRRRMNEADVIPSFKKPEPYQAVPDMSGQRKGSARDALRRKYGLGQ